jgi:hypothetical protein
MTRMRVTQLVMAGLVPAISVGEAVPFRTRMADESSSLAASLGPHSCNQSVVSLSHPRGALQGSTAVFSLFFTAGAVQRQIPERVCETRLLSTFVDLAVRLS